MHIECILQGVQFTYDSAKNAANRRKHGIDLRDVEAVFSDPAAITVEDRDHAEQRLVTLGTDGFGRLLVVVFTWRGDDEIRLISARRAGPRERRTYEG